MCLRVCPIRSTTSTDSARQDTLLRGYRKGLCKGLKPSWSGGRESSKPKVPRAECDLGTNGCSQLGEEEEEKVEEEEVEVEEEAPPPPAELIEAPDLLSFDDEEETTVVRFLPRAAHAQRASRRAEL